MKKLMFGMVSALALCGLADIESSNIVGYMQNNSTVAGLNLLAPGFQDVGYTSVQLAGLKVTNVSGGEVTTGLCGIDLIDENGNTLTHYSWASSGRGDNKTWGWKVGTTAIDNSVIFARGVGLLYTAETAGDTLTTQGEVNKEGLTISETVAGLNVIANPYPLEIKLSSITVTASDGGEVTTGLCGFDLIDADGNTLTHYSWASSGRGDNKTWGWKIGTTAIDDTVTVAPGQALLFTAENAGDKVIFPAQE